MDREEVLHKFHWHRWGASNMGAITISKEDMEEYYMLINDLIAENKKLRASCTELTIQKYREALYRAFAHFDSNDKFNKEVFLEMADLIAKGILEGEK